MKPVCYRIEPFRARDRLHDLDRIEAELRDFFAGVTCPMRILSRTRPHSFAQRKQTLQAQHAGAPAWAKRYVEEHIVQCDEFERGMLTVEHYLLLWPDVVAPLAVWEAAMQTAFASPSVTKVRMPAWFEDDHSPRQSPCYLTPLQRGDPYLTILTAWDVNGGWGLADVGAFQSWQRLLSLDVPLTLAIDVQTLDSYTADKETTKAIEWLVKETDHRSQQALGSAVHVQSVLATEALHLVRYAVLIEAPTIAQLDQRAQQVEHAMGRRLRVERVPGAQRLHRAFFTATPPQHVHSVVSAMPTTSTGLAAKCPWSVRRQSDQAGPLWGTDLDEGVPVHHEIFGPDGRENANGVILGTTGAGKTVAMQTIALRHALEGYQVVMLEPAHTCWKLRDAIGDRAAVSYHELIETPAINLLDVHSTDSADQRDSVVRKLSIALGTPKDVGGRIRVEPRLLNNREIGALDAAMQHERVYGPGCHRLATIDSANAPVLHDLIAALRAVERRSEAHRLAQELEDALLGAAAHVYNRPTALTFNPQADVLLYSFRGVTPERLPLLYDHLFGMINRFVWSPARDSAARPLLVFIDEFFYMASVRSLEQSVVRASKTFRNRRAGLFTADQNAETYYGAAGAEWGPFVTDNARHKLFFQLHGGAAVLRNAYEGVLAPHHIQALRHLKRGQCIAMLGEHRYRLQVDLLPLEFRFLTR